MGWAQPSGRRGPGPAFGDPRVMALAGALASCGLIVGGFTNKTLRPRIPGSHRYRVTDSGLRTAIFISRVHTRLLQPGLASLLDEAAVPTPLRRHLDHFTDAVDQIAREHNLAA